MKQHTVGSFNLAVDIVKYMEEKHRKYGVGKFITELKTNECLANMAYRLDKLLPSIAKIILTEEEYNKLKMAYYSGHNTVIETDIFEKFNWTFIVDILISPNIHDVLKYLYSNNILKCYRKYTSDIDLIINLIKEEVGGFYSVENSVIVSLVYTGILDKINIYNPGDILGIIEEARYIREFYVGLMDCNEDLINKHLGTYYKKVVKLTINKLDYELDGKFGVKLLAAGLNTKESIKESLISGRKLGYKNLGPVSLKAACNVIGITDSEFREVWKFIGKYKRMHDIVPLESKVSTLFLRPVTVEYLVDNQILTYKQLRDAVLGGYLTNIPIGIELELNKFINKQFELWMRQRIYIR